MESFSIDCLTKYFEIYFHIFQPKYLEFIKTDDDLMLKYV